MPLLPRRALITACIALAAVSLASNEAFPQDATGLIGDTTKNWVGLQVNSSEKLRVTATGSVGIGTTTPQVSLDLGTNTDALLLQSGTTGQRPTGVVGMVRYNTTLNAVEAYQGSTPAWASFLTSTSTIGSGIYLGTSTAATNPQRNGDATTGLFSDTATSVSVSIAGTERLRVTSANATVTGDFKLPAITNAYYLAGNKILVQPASDTTSFAAGPGALGNQAGTNKNNTAVGNLALSSTTTGFGNTAVGDRAMYLNTTGGQSVAVGRLALYNSNAPDNVAIGDFALYTNTTVGGNTAVGGYALYATKGGGNIAVGYAALMNTVTGSNNVAVGFQALTNNTAGNNNVALGYEVASNTLTTGSNNILIGTSNAVDTPATGTSNWLNIGNLIYGDMSGGRVGIGSATINGGASLDISQRSDSLLLPTGTTGQQPASPVAGMIRYNSTTAAVEAYQGSTPAWASFLTSTSTIGSGIYLGTSTAATNPQATGDATTGLVSLTATTVGIVTGGVERLRVTASGNVGIGNATPAQALDVTGAVKASVGVIAPKHYPASDSTTALQFTKADGSTNILNIDTTNSRVGIGNAAPAQALHVSGNINVNAASNGYYIANTKILSEPASDTESIAVGNGALASQSGGNQYNAAVGTNALNKNTTGIANTAVGRYALYSNTTSSWNTAVGMHALYSNTTGTASTAVGAYALLLTTTGINNTAVGRAALYNNTTGSNNTASGNYALQGNTTGGNNTATGVLALSATSSGSNNVAIGYKVASTTLATGSSNILIGTSSLVDTPASSTSNWLNIGNLIYGDMAAGNLGVGSSTINATLDVNGYAKLKINSSAPVACSATYEGSIAYTGGTTHYMCFCDGSTWQQVHSPSTACTW